MTAASLSLPMGTFLKVTFGGKAVVVVITDRGPYVEGRVLDLSAGAAKVDRAVGGRGGQDGDPAAERACPRFSLTAPPRVREQMPSTMLRRIATLERHGVELTDELLRQRSSG